MGEAAAARRGGRGGHPHLPPALRPDGSGERSLSVRGRPGGALIGDLAFRHWPGSLNLHIYLAHATGFCKEVWAPVVDELAGVGDPPAVTAWDCAGHGDSYEPPLPLDWWIFGRDAVRASSERPAVGVGHSSGGAALAMAEVLQPGTFAGLILIEPIVFPPPYRRSEDYHLATGAERRRECFESAAEAYRHFRDKEAFSSWDDRALRSYVDGGFDPRPEGWCLKCDPSFEAEVYRTATLHGAWERLPEIGCPVLVVAGERSDSHRPPFLDELAGRFTHGRVAVVPESGHFLPMERPARLAALVARFIREAVGEWIS